MLRRLMPPCHGYDTPLITLLFAATLRCLFSTVAAAPFFFQDLFSPPSMVPRYAMSYRFRLRRYAYAAATLCFRRRAVSNGTRRMVMSVADNEYNTIRMAEEFYAVAWHSRHRRPRTAVRWRACYADVAATAFRYAIAMLSVGYATRYASLLRSWRCRCY